MSGRSGFNLANLLKGGGRKRPLLFSLLIDGGLSSKLRHGALCFWFCSGKSFSDKACSNSSDSVSVNA